MQGVLCLPCPCPCAVQQRPLWKDDGTSELTYGLPCNLEARASSWSPMGHVPAICVSGKPAVDGNVQINEDGIAAFRNLRVFESGTHFVFVFSVMTSPLVNITSSPFDVVACSPHVLRMSSSSVLSVVADSRKIVQGISGSVVGATTIAKFVKICHFCSWRKTQFVLRHSSSKRRTRDRKFN